MNKLEIAIAKEFNRQNPITKFDGMDDQEVKSYITCDNCGHIEQYDDESEMFQGEMFVIEDKTKNSMEQPIFCANCVSKL
jgi:arginine decarboxylase-like protein